MWEKSGSATGRKPRPSGGLSVEMSAEEADGVRSPGRHAPVRTAQTQATAPAPANTFAFIILFTTCSRRRPGSFTQGDVLEAASTERYFIASSHRRVPGRVSGGPGTASTGSMPDDRR